MTDSHEIAWAAGLFDGEGTVFASKTMKRRRRNVRLHMAVKMTTRSDIERFANALGLGVVRGPYGGSGRKKPLWHWGADTEADVRACLAMLWPYLGENKREQARRAIAARDDHLANPEPLNLRKPLCRRGHDQSVYRRMYPSGTSRCTACAVLVTKLWRKGLTAKAADAPLFAEVQT